MEISSVAKRYAQVLYDYAVEKDAKEAVRTDCEAILQLIDCSREFSDFVDDPTILPDAADQIILSLFEEKAHAETLLFLRVLTSKGRLNQLSAICEMYELHVCEDLGVLKAEITAAHALSDAQVVAIKQKLRDRHKREIDAEVEVDPSLVGGFKIKVGDHIRDFSLRTKLENFEQHVINAKHKHAFKPEPSK